MLINYTIAYINIFSDLKDFLINLLSLKILLSYFRLATRFISDFVRIKREQARITIHKIFNAKRIQKHYKLR